MSKKKPDFWQVFRFDKLKIWTKRFPTSQIPTSLKSKTSHKSAIFALLDLKFLPNNAPDKCLTSCRVKKVAPFGESRILENDDFFNFLIFQNPESECSKSGLFLNHPARNPATWSPFLCFNTMSRKKLEKNVGNRNFRQFPCLKPCPKPPPVYVRRTPHNDENDEIWNVKFFKKLADFGNKKWSRNGPTFCRLKKMSLLAFTRAGQCGPPYALFQEFSNHQLSYNLAIFRYFSPKFHQTRALMIL